METEKLLPSDHRLDFYLEKYSQVILRETEDLLRQQDGNLLSVDIEFYSYALLVTFATIANTLEQQVIRTGDFRSYQVMYRSVVFAVQTARRIHEDYMFFDAATYLATVADIENGYEKLTEDVHGYLGENPYVSDLLDCYTDLLDESNNLQHLSELAGGMMFMLCERAVAEKHIMTDAENCSTEELELYEP